MKNFEFQCKTQIVFGKDTQKQVGALVAQYSANKSILLVFGGQSIQSSGLYDTVTSALRAQAIRWQELSGVVANPRLSLVRQGIQICKGSDIDFVLAVGGGSVIDTAKAVASGAVYDGDVWDFYCGKATLARMLPIGVVLTIPAAGSECSDSNVITNEETSTKSGFGSPLMRPVFSIMNPELTFTLPNFQTACGCADILAHVMERYFTNELNVELTDALCESIMRVIIGNLPVVLAHNRDYAARAEIMWAGTLAQNGLVGVGRAEDWANHGIEHQLSGFYDIAHGAGLSITYPAWMKYVSKSNPKKFVQFAVNVFHADYIVGREEDVAAHGIRALESFFQASGLPTRLSHLSIGDEKFNEMALRCTNGGTRTIGSYVPLGKADVINILRLAL